MLPRTGRRLRLRAAFAFSLSLYPHGRKNATLSAALSELERRDLIDVIIQPVGVKKICRARPGDAHFGAGGVGEIIHGRGDGQALRHVALVFRFERIPVIFHMPGEKDLFIVLRLCDGKPRRLRLAQHGDIRAGFHLSEIDRGMPRMRDIEHVVYPLQERVMQIFVFPVRENAEELCRKKIVELQ